MNLTVLVDNQTFVDHYYYGEPGLSFFIETGGKKILFDVGYSGIFLENAVKMGLDILSADYLVLSHGHDDHTGGLVEFIKRQIEVQRNLGTVYSPMLIAHPRIFLYKESKSGEENGSMLQLDTLKKHFSLHLTREPFWITDRLLYLGEIERTNDFENREPFGEMLYKGTMQDDYMMDDSALVYKGKEGLTIFTGCAHAGICNTIEYAKKVTGETKIHRVFGGFHLQKPGQELLEQTLDYLKKQAITEMYAGHCTDLESKIALGKVLNIKELGVGLQVKEME